MKKYLKGFFNLMAEIAILSMGLVFALNVLVSGFMFFPDLTVRTDGYFISNTMWWTSFVPGMLPTFFIVTIVLIAVLIMYKTVRVAKVFDIERVINEIKGKKGGDYE